LLGLYIAAGLKRAGWDVSVQDLYHSGKAWEHMLSSAGTADAAVVVWRDYDRPLPESSLEAVLPAVRRLTAQVLVAGTSSEHESEELARLPGVTACFHELPEVSIPRWLEAGAEGREATGRPSGPVDIDSIPMPAWELADLAAYSTPVAHRHKFAPVLPVLAIRGCPHKCVFCDKAGFAASRTVAMRSPGRVIEEIELLVSRVGAREIQFCEPVFNLDKAWVLDLCHRLECMQRPVPWSCHVRIDRLDREMLAAMARAGCWNVLFGIESGDDTIRGAANKEFGLDRARDVIGWCRELDIETTASFVLGLPGDTPGSVRKTIGAALDLSPDYAQFFLHKANVESPLNDGDRILDEWDFSVHDIPGRPYLPAAFASLHDLTLLKKEAYRKFYLRPGYVLSRLRRLTGPSELLRLAAGMRALVRIAR